MGDPLPRAPGRRAARPDPARLRGRRVRRAGGGGPGGEAYPRPRLDLDADGADVEAFSRRGPRGRRAPARLRLIRRPARAPDLLPRARGHPRGRGDGGRPPSRAPWADDGRHTSNVVGVRERNLPADQARYLRHRGSDAGDREPRAREPQPGARDRHGRRLRAPPLAVQPRAAPVPLLLDRRHADEVLADRGRARGRHARLDRPQPRRGGPPSVAPPATRVRRREAGLHLRRRAELRRPQDGPRAGRAATTGRRRDERLATCEYCLENRVLRDEQILARAERMYLCAPRGQLVEGYLAVVPYRCVGCLAHLPAECFAELARLLAAVQAFYAAAYGVTRPTIYEQGRAGGGATTDEAGAFRCTLISAVCPSPSTCTLSWRATTCRGRWWARTSSGPPWRASRTSMSRPSTGGARTSPAPRPRATSWRRSGSSPRSRRSQGSPSAGAGVATRAIASSGTSSRDGGEHGRDRRYQ